VLGLGNVLGRFYPRGNDCYVGDCFASDELWSRGKCGGVR